MAAAAGSGLRAFGSAKRAMRYSVCERRDATAGRASTNRITPFFNQRILPIIRLILFAICILRTTYTTSVLLILLPCFFCITWLGPILKHLDALALSLHITHYSTQLRNIIAIFLIAPNFLKPKSFHFEISIGPSGAIRDVQSETCFLFLFLFFSISLPHILPGFVGFESNFWFHPLTCCNPNKKINIKNVV